MLTFPVSVPLWLAGIVAMAVALTLRGWWRPIVRFWSSPPKRKRRYYYRYQ